MRALVISFLLLVFGVQEAQMVAPKVEHKKRVETQSYDDVTRSCPAGYEGHFVDLEIGFGRERYLGQPSYFTIGDSGELGYTVCFKKEFMDKLRKNPDVFASRPARPKPA